MTSASYCDLLSVRLRTAIGLERYGLLSKGVLLLPNNAKPHTNVCVSAETIRKIRFECFPHPLHSTDYSPFDYHIFGPVKKIFRFDEEVQEAVHKRLCMLRFFFHEESKH